MWESIKEQFKQVITYSQGIENPQVDELFDDWYKAKKRFIDKFNGLIYCFPEKVSFELDVESRDRKVEDFIEAVSGCYNNDKLADFIYNNKNEFFNNLMSKDYSLKDGNFIKKGTKIIKAFKYFEEDKKVLTILQDKASQLIQENKVEGYLCVSVHPLDFLSISENTHNWRSCHALDGDYRAGNLNYMADNTTVICYLRSENNAVLPNFPFPWTNKKWRVLLYVPDTNNMVIAGRQYPFKSSQGMNFIKQEVLPLLTNISIWNNWDDYHITSVNNQSLNGPYYPVYGELKKITDFVKNGKDSLQFNDVLFSSCYKPMYSFPTYFWKVKNENPNFIIGKKVNCLCCGTEKLTLPSLMRCVKCEENYGNSDDDLFGYCDCCGRHIYLDDAICVNDYDIICPECAENQTIVCDHCGRIMYKDEITYNRELEQYVCSECNENYQEEKYYGV